MKFHNQKSFKGHEISNVENKPLLHKKGKQWIVVAVSALILAGFGSIASTTTHADATNAQPAAATKVAQPNQASNSGNTSNVMQQAQGMHKALANNAAVQKPSVPSSAVAKKTTPASAASTASAKSSSVSASSSASSKASSSVNSASAKSSVASNSSNSNSNSATKPVVHMMLMGAPSPQTGTWGTAHCTLDNNGNLMVSDGTLSKSTGSLPFDKSKIVTIKTHNVNYNPTQSGGGYFTGGYNEFANLPNVKSIDLSGMNYHPSDKTFTDMFWNDPNLQSLNLGDFNGLGAKDNTFGNQNGLYGMLYGCSNLNNIQIGDNSADVLFPEIFTNGSQGTPSTIFSKSSSNNIVTLTDGQHHGGNWNVMHGYVGNWGTATWNFDTNSKTLYLANGYLNTTALPSGFNPNDVQHIETYNVYAPADASGLFAGEYNTKNGFANGFINVKTINLSGMNITNTTNLSNMFNNDRNLTNITFSPDSTSNVTDMGSMFAGDRSLQNLTLPSQFDTRNANISSMFDSDSDLTTLSLPSDFQNKNNSSTDVFGYSGNNQVPKLQTLILKPNTYLGTNANLPENDWRNGSTEVSNVELEKSTNHNDLNFTRYHKINILYTWWSKRFNYQVTAPYDSTISIGNSDAHNYGLPSGWSLMQSNPSIIAINNNQNSGSGSDTYWFNNLSPSSAYLTVSYVDSNNNPLGSFTFHDYNGNTHASYDNGTAHVHFTTAIRFGTNGKTSPSSWHQNNSDWICDASNIQSDWDKVPAGYHVVDTSTVYPELNDTKPIEVAPNESAADIIQYQYTNKDGHTYNEGNITISGPSGSYVHELKSKLENNLDVPAGYSIKSTTNINSKPIEIDKHTIDIALVPDQASADVQYQYNGKTIASDTIQGNSSLAKNASDTSTNITNGNDTGIPTGYYLANNSTNVPFDNGKHSVAISPNTVHERVFYKNGNTKVASDSISGNDSLARGASNTTFDANSKMPQGYQLADNQSKDINYDGQNHNIAITPIKVTDTINYQYNGKTLASHQFSGNNEHATQAGNNLVDVTSTNDSGISNGYHLVNKDNSFNYDGGTHNVAVVPNTESEHINYVFHSGASTFNEGSTIMTGSYGSFSNVNGSGLSAGYKLSNANTQFTYSNDNNSMNVSVVPSTATDTINYQYNHNTLTSQTFTGNDYRASQAGNNSFNVTSANDSKIPANYHLASANNSFSYNNQSYDVAIEPNQVTNTINYLYKGSQVSASTFTGNDYQAKDAGDTSFTISNGNAPEYYHLASGVQTSFSYNGSTSNVAVEPNTITVNYMNGSSKVSTSTSTFNGKHTTISDDFAIPTGYQLAQTNDSLEFTNPSSTYNVAITPIQKTDAINYMNNDVKVASDVYTGNDMYASDAGHTSYNANDYVPAGYHVVSDGGNTFYFDGQAHNVTVYPNAFIIKFNNGKLGSMPVSNLKGTTYKLDLNKLPSYYHLANNSSDVIDLDTLGKSTTYNINLLPNTITVNYKNGNNKISSDTVTFDGNKKDNAISADYDIPAGYQLAQANNQIQFNEPANDVDVSVKPISKTDIINYMYNGTRVGSAQVSGEDMYANDSTFDANDDVTAGYHAIDANNNFHYDGQNHNVVVKPNTITLNYKYNNDVVGYDTIAYNPNSKINDDYDMPAGYQLTQANNQLQFSKSANVVDVPVKPVNKTDVINYMNNGTKVSSTKVSGVDVYANGSVFNANKSVPVGYYAVDANNDFYYDGQQHDVAVKPDTITLNYMDGTKRISNDTVTFNGNSNISADYNIPAGYQLAQNNNQLKFNQPSNVVNVPVKPITKTDTINYMYNDTKVGSAKASGEDMYANASAFNANNGVPAGYHAVDSNNGFYYDGQVHDVSVVPNVDTDTVNYQANGKTLASQQFKGNDEHATQAGNNSFDVTAKNATKMPNGYELVNNNNEFSFDNGSHDVAVQTIPQPSVPFVPSMPTSSVSSSSASSSASASASASMAAPTSEKPTKAEPATHYQYTKVVTPLQLHTSKHFTKKNGVITIKHPTEFKIMKIVHDHKYTRYEVRYNHKNYFITANDHFTINNYVQKHDFKSHKHMVVKVIKPMIEYKHIHYSKKNAIRDIHKGAILSVKRVITIGKGEKTRFELTNGRFVTSNKLFVKVIK